MTSLISYLEKYLKHTLQENGREASIDYSFLLGSPEDTMEYMLGFLAYHPHMKETETTIVIDSKDVKVSGRFVHPYWVTGDTAPDPIYEPLYDGKPLLSREQVFVVYHDLLEKIVLAKDIEINCTSPRFPVISSLVIRKCHPFLS